MSGNKKALGVVSGVLLLLLMVVLMVTPNMTCSSDDSMSSVTTKSQSSYSNATSAAVSARNSGFAGEIPTADLERLKELYAIYVPDGSLDNEILARMAELNAPANDFAMIERLRRVCAFNKYPGGVISERVLTSGDFSEPVDIGGNKYRFCAFNTRPIDYRYNLTETLTNPGAKTKLRSADFLEARINELDSNPSKNEKLWVIVW